MEIKYSKFNRALALVDAMLQTFVVSPDDAVVSVGADELEVDFSTEECGAGKGGGVKYEGRSTNYELL